MARTCKQLTETNPKVESGAAHPPGVSSLQPQEGHWKIFSRTCRRNKQQRRGKQIECAGNEEIADSTTNSADKSGRRGIKAWGGGQNARTKKTEQ